MGMFDKFLSELHKGDIVRLTQKNGQVLEGTVTENDGDDAISLQVVMKAIVRYSAIDSVSMISHGKVSDSTDTVSVSYENSSQSAVEEKDTDISQFPKIQPLVSAKKLNFYVSGEQFSEAFGQLDDSDKVFIKTTYEAALNEYERYDGVNRDNAKTASENLISLSESAKVNDYKKMYVLAAAGAAMLENFKAAAEYFYYGDEMRNAYLSAYEGAYRDDDEEIFCEAAAFAALYILYGNTEEHLEEAAACLRESCVKCRDVSGIAFIFENTKDMLRKAYAYETLRQVADKAKMVFEENSVKKSLDSAKEKYSADKVLSFILDISAKKSQIPAKRAAKAAAPDPVPPVRVFDTEGKIVSLNAFGEKGQIIGLSGAAYEFDFKDIADDKIDKMIRNITKKSMRAEKLSIEVSFTAVYAASKLRAEKIKNNMKSKQSEKAIGGNEGNKLFSAKKYEEALE